MRPKKLKVGDTVRVLNEKRHIVSFIDDGGLPIIVYKVWRVSKKRWFYECDSFASFLFLICLNEEYSKEKRNQLYEINGLNY